MTTELATQGSTALAVQGAPQAQGVLSTDIIVPKVLLMQALSDFVVERKAQSGDFVRSTTCEKLGDDKTPFDFVPLKMTTDWEEQEKVGQKFEWRRRVPRTPANEHLPWSFYRNPMGQDFDKPGALGATEWRRVKVINVYALLPNDIKAFQAEMAAAAESGEMPDLNKTVLPVVISFRSTSFNAGKTVATFFAQVEEMRQYSPGVKHFAYTLPLSCYGDKNDKGSFFVMQVGQPKKLEKELVPTAERWYNTLSSMADIKVDNSGDSEAAPEGGQF